MPWPSWRLDSASIFRVATGRAKNAVGRSPGHENRVGGSPAIDSVVEGGGFLPGCGGADLPSFAVWAYGSVPAMAAFSRLMTVVGSGIAGCLLWSSALRRACRSGHRQSVGSECVVGAERRLRQLTHGVPNAVLGYLDPGAASALIPAGVSTGGVAAGLLARLWFSARRSRGVVGPPLERRLVCDGGAVESVGVLLSVARPLYDDDFGAMEETIKQRRCEHTVAVEGLGPLLELAVSCEDGRSPFVAL